MISTSTRAAYVLEEKLCVTFTSKPGKTTCTVFTASTSKQIGTLNPVFADTSCYYGT